LAAHAYWVLAVQFFGLVLGLGGATISDTLFFKFLKDLRISKFEANVLHSLSQIIWLGLGIVVVSGLALYVPNAESLNTSAQFLVKVIGVIVITINGAFLNLYIAPKLIQITFGQWHEHVEGELRKARKAAFAMGAISLISWYSVFLLGLMRAPAASFKTILGIYIGALLISVAVSQIVEHLLGSRPMPEETEEAVL